MEDGTLEIDAETLLKKTPLPKVGKFDLFGMTFKKLGKGMQDGA